MTVIDYLMRYRSKSLARFIKATLIKAEYSYFYDADALTFLEQYRTVIVAVSIVLGLIFVIILVGVVCGYIAVVKRILIKDTMTMNV